MATIKQYRLICPDPLTLYKAGVGNCLHAAVLVYIGRCGIQGTSVPNIVTAMDPINRNTIYSSVAALCEAGLLTRYSRKISRGGAYLYVVTKKAWEALTTPEHYHLFPDAFRPCVKDPEPTDAPES